MDDETAYHLNFLESLNERKDYKENFSDNNDLEEMLIFKQKAKNLLDMAKRNRKNNDIDYYEYILKKIKARIVILNEASPLPNQTPSPIPIRTLSPRQMSRTRTPSPRQRSRSRTPPRVTRRRRSQTRRNQNNALGRTPSPRQRSRSRTPPRVTRRRSQARRSRSRSIIGGKKN